MIQSQLIQSQLIQFQLMVVDDYPETKLDWLFYKIGLILSRRTARLCIHTRIYLVRYRSYKVFMFKFVWVCLVGKSYKSCA